MTYLFVSRSGALRTHSGVPDLVLLARLLVVDGNPSLEEIEGTGFGVFAAPHDPADPRSVPNVDGSVVAAELGATPTAYQGVVVFLSARGLTPEAELRIRLMCLRVRAAVEGRESGMGDDWEARVRRDAIVYSQGSVPSKKTDPFGSKRVWSRCPTELCVHPLGMHDQHMRCKIPGCDCNRLKGEYSRVN